MQFAKHLREPVMRGDVTCSVRIWQTPRVKEGGFYRLGPGAIEVTAIREISLSDITPTLARKSGFAGVVDLLKTAKHGSGEHAYLVEFVYHDEAPPRTGAPTAASRSRRRTASLVRPKR